MSKRRTSSTASRIEDDDEQDQSCVNSQVVRKRKRFDPSELCQQLYDSIRNIKKEDGSMLCDTFIRAPKRRQEPSYYNIVANPIDLLKIQQKLKTDSYEDISELTHDFELLVNNAKAFYRPESIEYQDACTLWQYVNTNRAKLLESAGFDDDSKLKRVFRNSRRSTANESEEATGKIDDDFNPYEELFASVMTATDPLISDRPLHKEFQLLPSKKIYPDYYDVIEHPIDLRLIATKIQTNAYSSLSEMEKDLLQMTKNACQFNEPGSQIYKDAKTLKKIFTQKKIDIENGKVKCMKKTKNISSALIAALKMEAESSDDEEAVKKGEGPMWALFDHLFNSASSSEHPNATGAPLGTSLWKLPYRRFHPEYFELIKRPISMCQIQTKLKKGDYANISDLTADLYLMLDNAKRAFPPSHRTHKDAVKMLKIMNAKLVEEALDPDMSDPDDDPLCTLPKKKGRPRSNSNISSPNSVGTINSLCNTSPKCRGTINSALKKKILSIQKHLLEFSIGNRHPIELFMEKPQRKIYPDYYDIIQNPIDMTIIENNIRSDKYSSLEEVVADYRLMFSNCRQYNEEGSPIYEDANILEKALNEKLKEFPGLVEIKKNIIKSKSTRKKAPMIKKLWTLFETIRDYQEPKGKRQLSLIFTKLPSKGEYPDYYDIIGDPIDMEKIGQKLKQNLYESIDDLSADILLMLENACKYNEPDSQIYKDALVLQQLTLQTKQILRDGDEEIPDVFLAVQELLLSLFTSLYNHQDEEGRCFSDSLAELPEYDEVSKDASNKLRGISFDLIKRRLDKGVYKRLDIFQDDVFACLERARKLSRTDSDIFQDAVELQTYFIKKRNELCKDTLSSKALNYTLNELTTDVDITRQTKQLQEEQDQEEEDKAATQGESMTIDQKVFSPGDFVYFEIPDNKIPGIAYIERLWNAENNIKMMQGCVFLRPYETYHVTTRKFLEQEVFKSNQTITLPLDKILTKCYVMNIKDFIRFKPDGFADKDVFVCESRYNIRARCFKKFKHWPFVRENDPVKFLQRDAPLELKRVMSVFKERVEKHKGELAELKLHETLIVKDKPNVECSVSKNKEEYITYYEQYNTVCGGVVKTGDFVYVATQTGKQSIVHIHSIWESSNKSYIQGPWLLTPNEISPPISKNIYPQELVLSSVKEVSPTIAIIGRCAVLEYQEYITCRPTEIPECDVFVCEYLYDEFKKVARKLSTVGGMKKFSHSPIVTEDEIFYFKSPIKPIKVNVDFKESKEQFDIKSETNDGLNILEDSLDEEQITTNSDVLVNASPVPSTSLTPFSSKIKSNKTNKPKVVTGYILYSCEVRKGICQSNPDASFGDISRMVGNEWKNLPASVKQNWEDKATKINEEAAARQIEEQNSSKSPAPSESSSCHIYECLWDKCDFQFEDPVDCMEHCIQDGTGHLQKTYQSLNQDGEYHCLWKGCIRMRKSMAAFPQLQRLIKHVREVHLSKGGRLIPNSERSSNFVTRKNPSSMQLNTNCQLATNTANNSSPKTLYNISNQGIHLEPQFVTVPPRPQRILHSEAYIRYIEGLQNNSPYIGPWKKQFNKTEPNEPSHSANSHGEQGENNEEITKSIWHLRNFLLNDILY